MTSLQNHDARSIRPATIADYSKILDVWRACGLGIEPEGRESESAFCAQLDRFAGLYFVATVQVRIVGVVLGTHDDRKGWINRLAVLPAFRRSGIAAALVRECESALRRAGLDLICALVEPNNTASLKLFEKLGFPHDIPVVYYRKPAGRPLGSACQSSRRDHPFDKTDRK